MADTDEITPQDNTAVATEEGGEELKPQRLDQTVVVKDIGPCKKHITVTIDRKAIDARLDEKYTELVKHDRNYVSGFRPGKAPRRIVERRYKPDVEREVRGELMLASLEQIAEEQDIAPLAPPNLDPTKIEIPAEGPMIYEFEVEVRPSFQLPNYKGLKLKRPTHTFTDADVAKEQKKLLEPYGQVVPKDGPSPTAALGDILTVDITTKFGGKTLNEVKEARVRVDPKLALRDGVCNDFGKVMTGSKPGDTKVVNIVLSDAVANSDMRGKSIEGTFVVHDIKTVRQPELTGDLLGQFGVENEDQLKELLRVVLERRLEYTQRQHARQQVVALVAENALTELPKDLLIRQARRAMQRKAVELQSAGFSEQEIATRLRMMEQDIVRSTTSALKEHFVLQKIAEDEKIEVNDEDISEEIERIAARSDESPRKVRARLEREDMMESLAAELIESKALDLILDSAEYEDFPLPSDQDEAAQVGAVEAQAVPGEIQDPTATPTEPAAE
ncbi:MAG: trigger factor [Gemmataceae bacterium]